MDMELFVIFLIAGLYLIAMLIAFIYIGLKLRKRLHDRDMDRKRTNELLEQMANETNDIPTQIQKLAELNRAGVLTDAEFQSKKEELLKRL